MINKELLTEILGIEILSSKEVKQTSIIRYKFKSIGETRDSSINTYELAHLCKKWAYRNNYLIESLYNEQNEIYVHWMSRLNSRIDFNGLSEPDSIFKACEYILEEIKKRSK